MIGKKALFSLLLALIFVATQVMAVGAAPLHQDETPPQDTTSEEGSETLTGVVDEVALETDEDTGETTVFVTYTDDTGAQNTVSISLEAALALGLVEDDGSGNYIVPEGVVGTTVEIDSTTLLTTEEEAQHPVGSALSDFFSDLFGVDYETVMDYHDSGVGFGVIAQALWMTNALDGDEAMFGTILDAKRNKDFSAITLEDGSTPQNWGQFRKAVFSDKEKAKNNLGAVMSGRAADGEDGGVEPKNNNGNGADKAKGKDKNKDKGKGKNKSD